MIIAEWVNPSLVMLLAQAAAKSDESWLTPGTIVAILSALGVGGVITAVLTLGPTRRKIRQEAESAGGTAASVLTSSAISLLNPMREQIDLLNVQIRSKDTHIALLEAQVRTLGAEPVDEPPIQAMT